jgi:hypothetical protein
MLSLRLLSAFLQLDLIADSGGASASSSLRVALSLSVIFLPY